MVVRQHDDDDNDEEIQLLQQPDRIVAKTPLPWDQFLIILLLQFSDQLVVEPLPRLPPKDIGVTHGDETQVGYYVGILRSSSCVTQTLTILYWSQLSDRIGRKPLILMALFAIASTTLSFGLSRSFLGLLVSRVICGAFDAQNGLVKNSLMDITDATNLPRAYSYLQISFMLSAIVGPIAGGLLSKPADRFPEIFGHSELLQTYPYLLSCAVPVICASIALQVTYFCFKETVSTRASLLDLVKQWFSSQTYAKSSTTSSNALASYGEANSEEISPTPLPLRAVLTRKVLTVAASNGALVLFDVGLYSILPIFYATPVELGGLSLDPPRIGAIFATSAFRKIFQILFFAHLHDRFGAYAILTTGLCSGIPIVVLLPVINALARAHGMGWAVWLAISLQFVLMLFLDMCFGYVNISCSRLTETSDY
ncbi:major facilitator superfamily domain-containing protein [Suillus spraguei]|nr:major facilitator superfamily domain-containing protein [Suillus spraguei]